jgi:hypothetical protein
MKTYTAVFSPSVIIETDAKGNVLSVVTDWSDCQQDSNEPLVVHHGRYSPAAEWLDAASRTCDFTSATVNVVWESQDNDAIKRENYGACFGWDVPTNNFPPDVLPSVVAVPSGISDDEIADFLSEVYGQPVKSWSHPYSEADDFISTEDETSAAERLAMLDND